MYMSIWRASPLLTELWPLVLTDRTLQDTSILKINQAGKSLLYIINSVKANGVFFLWLRKCGLRLFVCYYYYFYFHLSFEARLVPFSPTPSNGLKDRTIIIAVHIMLRMSPFDKIALCLHTITWEFGAKSNTMFVTPINNGLTSQFPPRTKNGRSYKHNPNGKCYRGLSGWNK